MKRTGIIVLLVLALSGCGGVQFRQIALYDHYEEPEKAEVPEAIIFEEGIGTMWNSLFDCGEFEVVRGVANSGNASIKISWDKGKGCEWIGFGNSFSNWSAVDMSEARLHQALSFYVRVKEGAVGGIPVVACLEDFGGGGSYHFVDARKYLVGTQIDTTWRQVVVPLWDFPIREDEVDIYSIKQVKFQLEGAGSYYLDDIKIIEYTPEAYRSHRLEAENMKPKGASEQTIYREGQFAFDAWGHENNPCQLLEEQAGEKGRMIHWKFGIEECSWKKWGLNWNGWYAVNLRGVVDSGVLKLRYKTDSKATFSISLHDFKGHSAVVFPSHLVESDGDWQTVEVPLNQLVTERSGLVVDQIRELRFEGVEAGEIWLDDIRITSK